MKLIKSMTNSLIEKLELHGVESTAYIVNPLSLDPNKEVADIINTFNPDVVMIFQQTESIISSSSSFSRGGETYSAWDIKLVPYNQDKIVWRASFKASYGGSPDISYNAKGYAQQIVDKLISDNIILK
ncbi:hypothetical protein BVG80_05640 [Sphingobacteriales bacterium TSM_CSM]|nr:hypothetical protein BVG80_05640 [Sphingobacteriales bacterium TSM_CSM]